MRLRRARSEVICLGRTGIPTDPEKMGGLDFHIPPPWAIAHHLIKAWVSRPSPWFPSRL